MDMSINIAGVEWKNPVTVASGTFGSGAEFADYVDINKLGAVTTKGVANVPWAGNPTPRVAEVYGGMMNAIGLQNPGIGLFCERDIPFLKQYDTKIIVNVCGHAPEEYLAVVERLADQPIDMMEINISCPNVNAGFLAFGQDAHHVEELTAQIKKIAKQPVIMKLTPKHSWQDQNRFRCHCFGDCGRKLWHGRFLASCDLDHFICDRCGDQYRFQ